MKGWTVILVNVVVVFCGGALGAVSRYLLGLWVNQRASGRFPLGTLAVNLVGSVLIGILARDTYALGTRTVLFAEMGFVGAFTTFSSLSYETLLLLEQQSYLEAFLNPVVSVILGLCGVVCGTLLGTVL